MVDVFESVTVTINKKRYDDLIRKEFAYDVYKQHVKENKVKGGYTTNIERALFLTDDVIDVLDTMPSLEDESEELFTEEEWDEIEAMVEKEEDNA